MKFIYVVFDVQGTMWGAYLVADQAHSVLNTLLKGNGSVRITFLSE